MLEHYFATMIERENIRKKREAGLPRAECTDDPIFPLRSFTNVKREYDRVSRELMEKFYKPNVATASPGEILFNCGMARWVNNPEAILHLGWQRDFDADALIARYEAWTDGAFFNPAYNISNFGQETKKFWLICERVWSPLWRHAEGMMKRTLGCDGYGWEYLCKYELGRNVPGYGADFMAKETVLDYIAATGWQPYDLNRYTPIGPGAVRGLNRIHGRPVQANKGSKAFGVQRRWLDETRAIYAARHDYLPANFVDLTLHDIQFWCCEYDKYERERDKLAAKAVA